MKSKKFVSLLLAACLSLSAMTVNAWAENGGENKEVPAPVVQEVEGEDKKDQETNEGENKETNKDETKETDKDENKAGEGEDKKNEETKPADPSAAVAYGTAAVAMALNNGNSNPPVDNESFVTVVKHIEGVTNEDLEKVMDQLERNPLTISFNNEEFKAAQDKRTADGWKWERPFDGTVTDNDVTETGNEVDGYNLSLLTIKVKKETSTSTTVTVTNYYTKKQTAGNFTIVKVDKEVTTKKLEGAQFTLTALNENGEPASEPAYENTTDANGEAKFENVPLGKYILKETVAPQGYQLPVDVTYEVVADERGVYIEGGELMFDGINFYIPNTQLPTPTTGNFTITKVDAANHDLKLTGAQFTLKKDGYVQTRTSDQGIAAFYDVPVGIYTLTETVAPQGYVKPNETYTVKVNENGKISVWKVTAPSGGDITVILPDDFIIQNPDGNVEVKDKNFVVTNKQVVPKPDPRPDPKPDDRPTYRYDDDDDYVLPTVTRKDNKKPANKPERAPRVEEVIPSKRNPETGSSSSMPIAMAAAAVSLTGLVVLCKKKDK